MQFKKLELIGFKSFADKTQLFFEPGVTAVVGPNGCGKSNISDAIKWVLGEQSTKTLRCSKMEDVIFSGSDQKESLGMAEVSLTICNQSRLLPIDYEEVTITRRLFRSGESEYLLNKTPVRLKDITDLIMDTGLGTSSYCMVEQGKIDMILSSKPEDRREVFEEASGINKFKNKKKEALRKLEQTDNNLLRINDIINEVKRQISSIERHAKKAEKYKEVFERLKELELKYYYFKSNKIKEEKAGLTGNLNGLEQEINVLNSEVEEKLKLLEGFRQKLAGLETDIAAKKERALEIGGTLYRNESIINLNSERIKEIGNRRPILEKETENLTKRKIAIDDEFQKLNTRLVSVTTDRTSKEERIHKIQTQLSEIEGSNKELEQLIKQKKLEIIEIQANQSKIRNDLAKINVDINSSSARARRLDAEKRKVEKEIAEVDKQLEGLLPQISKLEEDLGNLRNKRAEYLRQITEGQNVQKDLSEKLQNLQNKSVSNKSRLELLENARECLEGFGSGVRSILKDFKERKLNIRGMHGVLADLIEVGPEHEALLEVALGQDLQAIIVENEEAAGELIGYLTINNLGKAKFILLNKISPTAPVNLPTHPDIMGRLVDFVKIHQKFRSALESLIGDYIIVKDLETTAHVRAEFENKFKFITPQADVVWGQTIVAGGPIRTDASVLGRQTKINAIKEEIVVLGKQIEEAKEKLKGSQDATLELDKQMETANKEFHNMEIILANKNSVEENLLLQKKRFADELAVLDMELDEANQSGEENAAEKEKLENEQTEIQNKDQEIEQFIETSQRTIADNAAKKERALIEATQLKAELDSIKEREQEQTGRLNLLQTSLNEERQALESRINELNESQKKEEELKTEIANLRSQKDALEKEKSQIDLQVLRLERERKDHMDVVIKQDESARGRQSVLEKSKDQMHKLQLRLNQLQFEESSIKDKVQNRYKLDLDQEPIILSGEENWDEIEKEARELSQRLDAMGTVNLVAIEEHEQLKERLSFLTTQQEDLVNAKDSLHKAIIKINKTTRILFMETFVKIQETFKEYYKLLFGGGNAELILVDEQNILESGIEIIARPPGKRLQNISLLSGGERALTAIALIFAILKVKPSPFYMLDEIDAPLDESNIDRFSNLLADFVKQSQFIIITHNKKTITAADIMYGITMEQSGVSKVVSVKFAEEERQKEKETEPALEE